MNAHDWTYLEDEAIREAAASNLVPAEAAVLVNEVSHLTRTARSCTRRARRLGVKFAVRSSKRPIKEARPKTDSDEDVWSRRQSVIGDKAFQEAMFKAGAIPGVTQRSGTDSPRTIAPAVTSIGGSSAGWGQ